ncbi:MAG: Ada metal-binding domain-containing protein [Acidimicrobiales bacterium]
MADSGQPPAAQRATIDPVPPDAADQHEARYRAVLARDARFDGRFCTAVVTTGIYCRPSCPARTPKATNVRFYPCAAAAEEAGFRACKRCRPESAPGDPAWDRRGDVVGRAVRLIADGAAADGGVPGLARRLHVSERHLRRMFVEKLGTGPLQLVMTRRLALARLLLDQTDLPVTEIAFAAGFSSIRRCNDAMARAYGSPPSALRRNATSTSARTPRNGRRPSPAYSQGQEAREVGPVSAGRDAAEMAPNQGSLAPQPPPDMPARPTSGPRSRRPRAQALPSANPSTGTFQEGAFGALRLRLPARLPFAGAAVLAFLAGHTTPGVEEVVGGTYRRTVEGGVLAATPDATGLTVELRLDDVRRVGPLVVAARRLFDLDGDPGAVADVLGRDPLLEAALAATPGIRLPGAVDGFETAVRTVLGQQVSVAGATTLAARLVTAFGVTLAAPEGGLTALFPDPATLARADLSTLGLTKARADTVRALAAAVADEVLDLSPAADRDKATATLLGLPGVGPWTAALVAARALGDPDALPASDLALRRQTGLDARALLARAEAWRPWRSYATFALWAAWTTEKETR